MKIISAKEFLGAFLIAALAAKNTNNPIGILIACIAVIIIYNVLSPYIKKLVSSILWRSHSGDI